jgi:membrane protein
VLLTGLVQAVGAAALWWAVLRLLLGGRVTWRALLPGAVITGVGQSLVMLVSGLVVPAFVERESARYGLIGTAFVLVSWLVVLGVLLVVAAVTSAELTTDRRLDGHSETSTSATSTLAQRRKRPAVLVMRDRTTGLS